MVVLTRKRKAEDISMYNRRINKSVRQKNFRNFRTSRRITRALAKKMNFNEYKTSSRHAQRKNKHPRKFSASKMKPEKNIENEANVSNSKNVVVLYDGKENNQKLTCNSEKLDFHRCESDTSYCDFGLSSVALTPEDHKMINDVLDLMEDYGIIEHTERQEAFQNIQADLATTCKELESTIKFLTEEVQESQ